ncbi:hypothetical protein ACVIGB_000669 [Bradyrhizobium sp. USDA 4341]
MNPISKFRRAMGLAFIGDPHLSTLRPGRRKDADFGTSVLTKIEAIIDYCNEHQLIPVFTGDMFDSPETRTGLVTKLIRTLGRGWTYSITNTGNHDMEHTALSDGDSLELLKAASVLLVVSKSGPVEEFLLGEDQVRVGLGMTPYGQPIPTDVAEHFPEAATVVWCTHHDLMFKAYPGNVQLHEILGCSLVVNGHIHIEKPDEIRGETRWTNPGNITRMAIDALDHVPAIAVLRPGHDIEIVQFPDPPDLFDLTGYHVEAASAGETARVIREETSAFVELLKNESSMELNKSDDGALLREEIEAKCDTEKSPAAVRAIMMSLLEEAVARANGMRA